MDGMTLFLMLMALGIGLLIGLLVNGLKEKASEPSSEIPDIPSPPRRGFQQAGTIWKDKESKIFLEIDDELISAADFFLEGATRSPAESTPAPRSGLASSAPPTPAIPQSPPQVKEEEEQLSALSIVEQVDDILQEMVVNSPLNEKDIHLMDDPQKGMKIWIGNSSYDDIEDISDSDVRELIKGAVAEWESRAEKD